MTNENRTTDNSHSKLKNETDLPSANYDSQRCDTKTYDKVGQAHSAGLASTKPLIDSLNQYTTKCSSKSPNTPKEQMKGLVSATLSLPALTIGADASAATLATEAQLEAKVLVDLAGTLASPSHSTESTKEAKNDANFTVEDKTSQPARQLQARTEDSSDHTKASAQVACKESTAGPKFNSQITDSSINPRPVSALALSTPWRYHRRNICQSLAAWCKMCDSQVAAHTIQTMEEGFPCVLRSLSLWDLETSRNQPIEDTLIEFCRDLERLLPDEYQECLVYALLLIERGFKNAIFLHSITVKRLLAVAFGFAFKMVAEIDWMGANRELADLLGIKTQHFNEIESAIFQSLDFDIGVSEEKFQTKFQTIDEACKVLFAADEEKIRVLNTKAVAAKQIGVSDSPTNSPSSDLRAYHDSADSSEEEKVCSASKSRQQDYSADKSKLRLGGPYPSDSTLCSSPGTTRSTSSQGEEIDAALQEQTSAATTTVVTGSV